jgi:hypothetical protein
MFWTAFDCGLYERAFFYADAAVSEDQRIDPNGWKTRQACNIFRLKNTGDVAAGRVVDFLTRLIQSHIDDFNAISGKGLTTSDFDRRFVQQLIDDAQRRAILSGLFSLIAEFEALSSHLNIRSQCGGSIYPFLTHLFRGALVLESLLKWFYPTQSNGDRNETLGGVFKTHEFQREFGLTAGDLKISANSLSDALRDHNDPSIDWRRKTLLVAGKIRNTTGHNLLLPDIFKAPEDFNALFKQELRAIFWVLETKCT